MKVPINTERDSLIQIAQTSLRTKLTAENADILTDVCSSLFSILSVFRREIFEF